MFNKKLLAIVTLLSHSSFGHEFYLRGGYYGELKNQDSLKIKHDVKIFKKPSSDQYSPKFSGGFALGYQGNSKNRFELELLYSQIKKRNNTKDNNYICLGKKENRISVNDAKIENTAFMINSYYQTTSLPYFGAGIGFSKIKIFERDSVRPAYQLKAGVNHNINSNMSMYLGYRHFGVIGGKFGEFDLYYKKGEILKTKSSSVENGFFGTHGIEIGISVKFIT
ncbi:MAG: P44/Msp2 family outer membrane protein [Wolbachia endosymbiont of Fragariocoptes setiger]|nr:P44/Msp2 family outer membrane protein [Wolbachia endosymbiont of Fragariocoptes setiger]